MIEHDDLSAATPSGALAKDSGEFVNTMLWNGVTVDSRWGSISDGVEGADGQRLVAQWEGKNIALAVRAGSERVTIDDEATQWYVAITTDQRLLLSVRRGRTPFGQLSEDNGRMLLAFSWNLADVATVYVGRVKKYMKWWNEEVILSASDGEGTLHLRVLRPYVGTSGKALAKSMVSAGNAVHDSFVTALGDALARSANRREPGWKVKRDGNEETWELELAGDD